MTACTDPVGCFLTAYDEYLDGKRDYADLPPTFRMCPDKDPDHARRAARREARP